MKPAQNLERRDKARLPYVCPIIVNDLMSGETCSASMFNHSGTGIYFESDALLEGHAVDISPSGIFIKSGKRVRTGQIITLKIPDKTGKDVFVQGKVVWSNADGFGLKFIVK
jgi:hypothetical protein